MATEKLINQSQGESIISNLGAIATNLQNVSTIEPSKFGMGYAVCDTPAATVAKTAVIANYVPTEGALVTVKFTYGNTASGATLKLTATETAKPILYKGQAITSNIISAGDICTFIYSTNAYNIINLDALSGAGAGTVRSVGAEGGIITDQTGGAAINQEGKVKLNLKSPTPFSTAAPNPTEIANKVYPVALDSAGHPAVSIPCATDADINLIEDMVCDNEFDTTTAYAVGDYVTYENSLYEFISAHSAGAWNSNEVTEISLIDVLGNINTVLEAVL